MTGNKFSRFTHPPITDATLMGHRKLFGGASPFENEEHNRRLTQVRDWLQSRRNRAPSPPPMEVDDDDDEERKKARKEYMDWHPRGLHNPADRDWVVNTMWSYGLDVRLEIPELPIPSQWEARKEYLEYKYSYFWTHNDWNLIKINIHPGPLWIDFVASNFNIGDNHYHISLCYRDELWDWWHLKGRTLASMDQWIHSYNTMRRRYDGKRARLRGRLTNGYTLALDGDTRVEGLDEPYIIYDGFAGFSCWEDGGVIQEADPEPTIGDHEVRFVHMLPGNNFRNLIRDEVQQCLIQNRARAPGQQKIEPWLSNKYKSLQQMHVSMLLGDKW